MKPVGVQVFWPGSYSSAVPLPPILPKPPETSTWPEGSKVAVWWTREAPMLAVEDQVPVVGSYTSALGMSMLPVETPPDTSTSPEGNTMAVCAERGALMGVVGVALSQSRPTEKVFEADRPWVVVAVAVMTTPGSDEGQAGAVQTTSLPVPVLWGVLNFPAGADQAKVSGEPSGVLASTRSVTGWPPRVMDAD